MKKLVKKLNSIPFLITSGIFLLGAFVLGYVLPYFELEINIPINLAWFTIIIASIPILGSGLYNLILYRQVNSNLVVFTSIVLLLYMDEIFLAGGISLILAFGYYIEDRYFLNSKKHLSRLWAVSEKKATKVSVLRNGTAKRVLPVEKLEIGDVIRVLPGGIFPGDGKLLNEPTTVNEFLFSNNKTPLTKNVGDIIYAGSTNLGETVDYEIIKLHGDSSLQQMIRCMEGITPIESEGQIKTNSWAYLMPSFIFLIALLTFILFNNLLFNFEAGYLNATSILLVFSPSIFFFAHNVSIFNSIINGAKRGIYIKSASALEKSKDIDIVVFDKSSAITLDDFKVTEAVPFGITEEELLSLAGSANKLSPHPIGKAIFDYAVEKEVPLYDTKKFDFLSGKGVTANLKNLLVLCGNEKLFTTQLSKESKEVFRIVDYLRNEGKTAVIVGTATSVVGVLGLSCSIRDSFETTVSGLNSLAISRVAMMTGEATATAKTLSQSLNISEVYASLLPSEKVDLIDELVDSGSTVCVVGQDALDEIPIESSSVGISINTLNTGVDNNISAVAILKEDLTAIPYLIKLSLASKKSIEINIKLALVLTLICVPLAAVGIITPLIAAVLHFIISLAIFANVSRIRNKDLDNDNKKKNKKKVSKKESFSQEGEENAKSKKQKKEKPPKKEKKVKEPKKKKRKSQPSNPVEEAVSQ